MARQTYDPEDDEQSRDLMRTLGDEFNQRVLRLLLAEPMTQAKLATRMSMKQPTLSRRLAPLRLLGLVRGGTARGTVYRVDVRDELFDVLLAVARLAEAVNADRTAAQQRSMRQTRKERLQTHPGEEELGRRDG